MQVGTHAHRKSINITNQSPIQTPNAYQTQEKSLYPKLLRLLKPFSTANSATLLGWHAEGPFLEYAKRGAHVPSFLLAAPDGIKSFEEVYGAENLADSEDWLMSSDGTRIGVRMITAAPEIEGVMQSIGELDKRGIVFSIGHRYGGSHFFTYVCTYCPVIVWLPPTSLQEQFSMALASLPTCSMLCLSYIIVTLQSSGSSAHPLTFPARSPRLRHTILPYPRIIPRSLQAR